MARRNLNTADKIVRGFVMLAPAVLAVGVLHFVNRDDAPETSEGTDTPVSQGTLRCLGLRALWNNEGDLRVTPKTSGNVPPGTTVTYRVGFGGTLKPPIVEGLGETTIQGRPSEVQASLNPGGNTDLPLPCQPWKI